MLAWVVYVDRGRVSFEGHNIFTATDEVVVAGSELRFRSLAELSDSLINAGFTIEHIYGDWDCGSVSGSSRVMVFIARRNPVRLDGNQV